MKTFALSILLLICLVLSHQVQGQLNSYSDRAIKAAYEFRSEILKKDPHTYKLKNLVDQWKRYEPDSATIDYLLFNITHEVNVYHKSFKDIKKQIKKHKPSSLLSDSISVNDIEIFKLNDDLLSMVTSGYLCREYPYKLDLDSMKIKEFEFMDIQEGEVVADIGSGVGDHIIITALGYPSNDFILNEISQNHVEYLQKKVENHRILLNLDQREIRVVKGKSKNVNLGITVDRVIIKNAFHHFSNKKHMLKSIKQHLNDNGKIVLIEPLKEHEYSENPCKEKITYLEIIECLNKTSIKIEKEEIFQGVLLLVCYL